MMKQWLEKIIEKLLVNVVWNILKAASISLFSLALIWINTRFVSGADHYILSIVLFFCFVIAFFVLRYFFGPQYPQFRWDIIHGKNKYILSFQTREVAEYAKTIQAIPLRDDIKSFPVGDYVCTGDSSVPRIDPEDAFSFKILDESCGAIHKYVVEPKNTIKAYTRQEYTIYLDLNDENKKMEPRNYIYIKRPTRAITLELTIPKDIPIKNVRFKAKTKYGEERVFIDHEGILTSSGGKTIGSHQYVFNVPRPKMFCEYEICWEWDNAS